MPLFAAEAVPIGRTGAAQATQSKRECIQYEPEISAGGAELAEQAAADVVAVEEEELVQAGAREAGDGGVLEASAVEAQAPQARVRRQQRAQQLVRQGHLLQQSPKKANGNEERVSLMGTKTGESEEREGV